MTTKCAKVRELLQTPSTVAEVAALLELNQRSAQLGVWMLTHTGQAEVCGHVPNPSEMVRGRRTLKLYRLTRRGQDILKRDRKKKRMSAAIVEPRQNQKTNTGKPESEV